MDVREQILAEATRLMADNGFSGTSLQSIADAVGIRKPSVLYHFPSKEAVRQGVLDQLLHRWNEVLPRLMRASARAGVERFDAVMAEIMGFFASDPDRARLLMREMLDRPGAMEVYLANFVRPWMDIVVTYIERGQRIGEIRPDVDPAAYVLQVSIFCVAAIATASSFGTLLTHPERPDLAAGRDRFLTELVRLARASLFLPHAATALDDAPAPGDRKPSA